MSDPLPDLTTFLPPDFLSGDMNHHHHLPYYSSTESEFDDHDVTGLTHPFTRSLSLHDRLERKRVTLNRNVTPTTSFGQENKDYWALFYAALKMKRNTLNDAVFVNETPLGAPRPPSHHNNFPHCTRLTENEEFLRRLQFRRRVDTGGNNHCSGPVGFGQPAWPTVDKQRRQEPTNGYGSTVKPIFGSFSGGCGRGMGVVKKERAGTGVFLPRSYNISPVTKNKPGSFGYVQLPPKKKPGCLHTHMPAGVAQSWNKSMDPIIAPSQQPNVRNGFTPQYYHVPKPNHFNRDELGELVTARRNAVRSVTHEEVVLPQEWTY